MVPATIPHNTTFAFGFDFPKHCVLGEATDGPVQDDEDDEYPKEKQPGESTSLGSRATDMAQMSVPAGRRPSMQERNSSVSGPNDAGPSGGFSPSSWRSQSESKSPTGFSIGKMFKRNSTAGVPQASGSAQSPEPEGKMSFLRRLSTSQSVTRPPLDEQYDLPPSFNLLLGDVQAEVHYHIKICLRRSGLLHLNHS
jgi:hypothetical protein